MKNYKSWMILLLLPILATAQHQENEVTSTIKHVTVFTSGAQVFRTADVALTAGQSTVVFVGLTQMLRPESVNVKVGDEVTVLSVHHRYNFLAQKRQSSEVEHLKDSTKWIKIRHEDLGAELQVYTEEKNLLLNNKVVAGHDQGLVAEELRKTADLFRNRLKELSTIMLQLQREQQALSKTYQTLNLQISELEAKLQADYNSEVVVQFSTKTARNQIVELSYLVREAKWTPNYDLRVKDVQSPLTLAYKADVEQQTGEDWEQVKITLSTGKPTLSHQAPVLQPWMLRFVQPQSYRPPIAAASPYQTNTLGQTP